MQGSKFTRVSQILPDILKKTGIKQKLEEQKVLALWGEVMGSEIAARSKAVKLARGVLYVQVEHGAWMQELRFLEKKILEKFSKRVPNIKIERIHFSGMGKK